MNLISLVLSTDLAKGDLKLKTMLDWFVNVSSELFVLCPLLPMLSFILLFYVTFHFEGSDIFGTSS